MGRRIGWPGRAVSPVLAGWLCVMLVACSDDRGGTGQADGEVDRFVISTSAPVPTLDVTNSRGAGGLASLVTEPLERDPEASGQTGLAASVQESRDRIVYTLEPDATFTDGDPVTAEDVVYSIERAADPESGPETAPLLGSIAQVKARGEHRVTVTLVAPDPGLRSSIASLCLVVKKADVEAHPEDWGSADALPVGSGPYIVSSMRPDEIVFERNESYWGELPPFREVAAKVIEDDSTAQLAMRSGDLNMQLLTNVTGARTWESVPGATLTPVSTDALTYLSFDVTAPPFDDIHVRRAIAHAVDKESLVELVYGGYAELLHTMLTTEQLESLTSQDQAAEFLATLPTYEFDLNKAAAELAASDHAEGFSVEVPTMAALGFGEKTLLALQQNLEPLNIDIEVTNLSTDAWTAQVFAHEDLGMQTVGAAPPTSDPASILGLILGSEAAQPNGYNLANFTPPEVDTALAVVSGSTDAEKRYTATQKILHDVATEVPYVPLFNPQFLIVTGDGFGYDQAAASDDDMVSGGWIYKVRPSPGS